MKNIRFRQLDALRGVFALMVILIHFPLKNSVWTDNFLVRQSDMFVDFFFVLSGFVISYNYFNKITGFKSYYHYLKKRFLRLYPLLFYSVLLYLIFLLIFNEYFPQYINRPESPKMLLFLTLDSLTFMNSTIVFSPNLGMNYPSWSISAEMISYVIFGLTALFFGLNKKYIFLISLLFSASFLFLKRNYMMEGDWGFVRGIVCFNTGIFTFLAYNRYNSIVLNKYLEYLIPFILLLLFYCKWQLIGFQREVFTLLTIPIFFGSSIFIYALSKGFFVRVLLNNYFQFIGRISYSIYLNHGLVLILVTKIYFNVFKIPHTEFNILVSIILSFIATIFYSHFTYKYIELKGMNLYTKREIASNKPQINSKY